MATSTIPQLTQAIAITGDEQMEAVQAGTSVRVTTAQIAALGALIGPSGPQGLTGAIGPTGPSGLSAVVPPLPSGAQPAFAMLPNEITSPVFSQTSDAGLCFFDGTQWNICGLGQTRIITASGLVQTFCTDRNVGINKIITESTSVALYVTVAPGHRITISDVKGDAATNNITITPASGTIDGSATYLISTAYGSWSGYWTGAIWKTG
jgi:hypothetical protein